MASTFSLLPENGVKERWDWRTDVMTSWNGSETRLALIDRPRITQQVQVKAVTPAERRELMRLLADTLANPDIVPLWAWSARINSAASSGTDTVTCDTERAQLAVDDYVVLLNADTAETQTGIVSSLTSTSVTLVENLLQDVNSAWVVYKAMSSAIDNRSIMDWSQADGKYNVKMQSWVEPKVQRDGSSASLTTFNSLPYLERDALTGGKEKYEFPRSITDFGIGTRTIGTRHPALDIVLKREYQVNRLTDVDDADYWRLFLDTVKGNHKAFLINTQISDMTLATNLVAAATSMSINELEIYDLFHSVESYKNFEILYSDGTVSRHTISASNSAGLVTFAPGVPNDAKVTSVEKISYLLKVRMSDTLEWRHQSIWSKLSFEVRTTDDG
jgi:hypothetical protein